MTNRSLSQSYKKSKFVFSFLTVLKLHEKYLNSSEEMCIYFNRAKGFFRLLVRVVLNF